MNYQTDLVNSAWDEALQIRPAVEDLWERAAEGRSRLYCGKTDLSFR